MRERTSPPDRLETPAGTSRRDFLKSGAGLIAGSAAAPWLPGAVAAWDQDDETLERLERARGDPNHRILLRGGTVISMDPTVGNFAKGDVLIQGKRIVAVGPDLAEGGSR